MSAGDSSRRLAALFKRLRADYAQAETPLMPLDPADAGEPLLHEIVYSLLLWEASTSQAKSAYRRLREHLVDFNELRVCFADEIAQMIGERYPRAAERAQRIRGVLHDVYKRQHRLTLAPLREAPRNEAQAYIRSLDGLPPFSAARVLCMGLSIEAVPVDARLHALLAEEGVVKEGEANDESILEAAAFLDRTLKSAEVGEACRLLQAWSDDAGHAPKRERADAEASRDAAKRKPQRAAKSGEPRRAPAKKKAAEG